MLKKIDSLSAHKRRKTKHRLRLTAICMPWALYTYFWQFLAVLGPFSLLGEPPCLFILSF